MQVVNDGNIRQTTISPDEGGMPGCCIGCGTRTPLVGSVRLLQLVLKDIEVGGK